MKSVAERTPGRRSQSLGYPSEVVGKVDVMELLGAELHLYVTAGMSTFVATVDPRMDVNAGDDIDLVLDMNAAHLFDKETERAIR